MTATSDNGNKPAYPSINPKGGAAWNNGKGEIVQEPAYKSGLTKREIFAMAAMQGIIANGGGGPEDVVHRAICMADELLKQLES